MKTLLGLYALLLHPNGYLPWNYTDFHLSYIFSSEEDSRRAKCNYRHYTEINQVLCFAHIKVNIISFLK